MAEYTTPNGGRVADSMPPAGHRGVRGWLLVLCLMLTVVGPLIASGLMAYRYVSSAPYFASSRGLEFAIFISIAIEACSLAYGIYAGIRLWTIQPGAVTTAKRALLFGLAANAVTTALQIATGPATPADGRLLHAVTMNLIPDLIFFTMCFAYLNKSTRVQATYQA
jgi:hypothetical protein